MIEIWKDVPNYEQYFMVSDLGNVWSKRTDKILKPTINKQGYATIATIIGGKNGKYKTIRIHRMVAMAFLDNPMNKPVVNHKDGNKRNNNLNNLEWCTSSENAKHSFSIGLSKVFHGSNSKLAKLNGFQVDEIRENYKKLKEKHCDIAKKYNVSTTTITNLLNYKIYKNQ